MAQEKILLAHGGGGSLTSQLVREKILRYFPNPILARLEDAAILRPVAGRLAFTTDSFVVSPIFFPGGDIGDLAVCGTVNDLAMSGSRPLYLSLAFILEEGLAMADLERILQSIQRRAAEAHVEIVCGDTKVVAKGQADGLFINTAGIGEVPAGAEISLARAQPGDALVVSGALGLHGLAVMLSRGKFSLQSPILSDVALLYPLVEALLREGIGVRALRDITRGGLAMALTDLAEAAAASVEIDEATLPFDPGQHAACDLLGLDQLHLPCEGRFLLVCPEAEAARAVAILRQFPTGKDAAIIGKVLPQERQPVFLRTRIGTRRVVMPPRGEQLPRIC